MERVLVMRERLAAPQAAAAGTVVNLADYRRVSRRLRRFLRRQRFAWISALIGTALLSSMITGALFDSSILKGIAWVSTGFAFCLIIPFSWWLNGSLGNDRGEKTRLSGYKRRHDLHR